jgi:plastocyanin
MKQKNILAVLTLTASLVLLGVGCGNNISSTQTTAEVPGPVTPNPEESGVNTLPQSESAPRHSSSQPVPESTPQPTPVVPPKSTPPAPAPTPAPAPQPTPTPAPQPVHKTVSATISGFAFQSAAITINHGDTITWTNNDGVAHTVTADDGSFDSGSIAPGTSYSHTFSSAGTAVYHCTPHPSMRATIIVK